MIDQASIEFSELTRFQLSALHLLQNLGYTYLSPREALTLRGGRADAVLLESVLLDWLARNNEIQYQGQRYPFSEANIHTAVQFAQRNFVHRVAAHQRKHFRPAQPG